LEEERERINVLQTIAPASWRSLACTKVREERENQCASIVAPASWRFLSCTKSREDRERINVLQ
jgi:hypothetical protein